MGAPDGTSCWRIGPQQPLLIVKSDDRGDPALSFYMGLIPSWFSVQVIPKTLKLVMVPACNALVMKKEPGNITGWPGVSIM